jgi:electron transport complex protein RnfG
MAKTVSTFRNMVLSLTIIALASSACLGFVYEFTKRPIELSNLNKKLKAIRQVVPEFNNNPGNEMFRLPTGEGDSLDVYPAKVDQKIVGYAVNSYTTKGFSGRISVMAGFNPDGTITGITVIEHKETPGLGSKMNEPAFRDQFISKNPSSFILKVRKDGGTVDATIRSRAFCDALQRAYSTLEKGGLK